MLSCFLTPEKTALEKRVKELEESLATRNAEAEKVTKDTAAREEQFVNRVAFLTQNVRGKFFDALCCLFELQIAVLTLFHVLM